MSRPTSPGGRDIDPFGHERVRAAVARFMAERAPYEPGALALISHMAADLLVTSRLTASAGWSRPQFETVMLGLWQGDGIDVDEMIDASGLGDVHSLRSLAFEAAAHFAEYAPTPTPDEA